MQCWSEWSQNTPEPRLGTLCVTVRSESWVLRQAREWRVRIFLALYCCQQVQHASPSFRQGGWNKTWRLRPSQYWLCLRAFAHKLCVFSYFWGDHSPLDVSMRYRTCCLGGQLKDGFRFRELVILIGDAVS